MTSHSEMRSDDDDLIWAASEGASSLQNIEAPWDETLPTSEL